MLYACHQYFVYDVTDVNTIVITSHKIPNEQWKKYAKGRRKLTLKWLLSNLKGRHH